MKSGMVKYHNLVAGWLDSSVHDQLIAIPSAFQSIHFALVTCLDSNRDLAASLDASSELNAVKEHARPLGRGLLLRTSVLLDVESTNRVMFGFDEVWFFPNVPVQPKPEGHGLVGPRRINQETMESLGRWMENNSCSLALGDGEGLNFILQARGLVRYFIGNSIQQPTHSNTP